MGRHVTIAVVGHLLYWAGGWDGRREEEEGGRYIAVDKSLFGNGNKTRIRYAFDGPSVYEEDTKQGRIYGMRRSY